MAQEAPGGTWRRQGALGARTQSNLRGIVALGARTRRERKSSVIYEALARSVTRPVARPPRTFRDACPLARSVARPPGTSRGASPGTSAGASLGTFSGASPWHVPRRVPWRVPWRVTVRHSAAQHNTAPGTVSSPSISSALPLPIAQLSCFEKFPCLAVLNHFPGSWVDHGIVVMESRTPLKRLRIVAL